VIITIIGSYYGYIITVSHNPAFAVEAPEHPSFVTSDKCSDCHQEQREQWSGSDHSWAWRDTSRENVFGNFDNASFSHHGITTRFFRDEDRYLVETKNAEGVLEKYEIKYVVGVRPLQQYLIERPGGRLQVLDIAWDTENKKWLMVFPEQNDNVPGNALHWTGVYKNWNGRCAECHATNFRKNYNISTRSFDSKWSEMGVTCESCHGPGEAHVEWAQSPESFALKDYLGIESNGMVKSSARTSSEKELLMCSSCHSRRSAFSGSSPLPGAPFSDSYDIALLRPDLYHMDGQIKDEVYVLGSFLQSKMHDKGVVCSDCHNPHSGAVKVQGDGLCTQCHNPAGNKRFSTLKRKDYESTEHHFHDTDSKGSQCVSCHMPEETYMEVDRRRDHQFGIPKPHNSLAFGAPNACIRCHEDKTADWADDALKSWYPASVHRRSNFATTFAKFEKNPITEDSVKDILSIASSGLYPAIIRATALSRLDRFGQQLPWEQLSGYLKDESPYIRTAAARLFQLSPDRLKVSSLAPLLYDQTRAVRIGAAKGLLNVPARSISPEVRTALSSAFKEYQKSLVEGADHPNVRWLWPGWPCLFAMLKLPVRQLKRR